MEVKQDLWGLIEHFCTADEIREVLREYREDHKEQIRISGPKEGVVTNLRHAVQKGIIPEDRVLNLLREAEENGNQHIFYFTPKTVKLRQQCVGAVFAENLWGDHAADLETPRFELVPEDYVWAEFRRGLPKKPNDWVAKLYGHEVNLEYDKEREVEDEGVTKLGKLYIRKEVRVVSVIRWNSPDLLEIRIPRSSSLKAVDERLAIVWSKVASALDPGDFAEWELKQARCRMLDDRKKHREVYRPSTLHFRDSESGRAEIHPHTDDEAADSAKEREEAIEAYLKAKADCNNLRISWMPQKEVHANWKDPLATICGGRHSHELLIAPATKAAVIDYVTNKLREFNR